MFMCLDNATLKETKGSTYSTGHLLIFPNLLMPTLSTTVVDNQVWPMQPGNATCRKWPQRSAYWDLKLARQRAPHEKYLVVILAINRVTYKRFRWCHLWRFAQLTITFQFLTQCGGYSNSLNAIFFWRVNLKFHPAQIIISIEFWIASAYVPSMGFMVVNSLYSIPTHSWKHGSGSSFSGHSRLIWWNYPINQDVSIDITRYTLCSSDFISVYACLPHIFR